MNKKSLVIIPTYNEKDNIGELIRVVFTLPVFFDILVVDDNSEDGTIEEVENLILEYRDRLFLIKRPCKLGLGTAYITGFKWALEKDYEYIFEMDADFSHNPNDLIRLLKIAEENAPCVVVGSRYVSGVNVLNWPIERILISYFGSVYVRKITGLPVKDTTAGFVCYHRKVLETINLDKIKMKGYGFQIEMKFYSWKFGFKIIEIPIVFTDRKKGVSKMSGGIMNEAIFGVILLKLKSFFMKFNKK